MRKKRATDSGKGNYSMEHHIKAPMDRETAGGLRAGDYVYITGTIYTARDAPQNRMQEAL